MRASTTAEKFLRWRGLLIKQPLCREFCTCLTPRLPYQNCAVRSLLKWRFDIAKLATNFWGFSPLFSSKLKSETLVLLAEKGAFSFLKALKKKQIASIKENFQESKTTEGPNFCKYCSEQSILFSFLMKRKTESYAHLRWVCSAEKIIPVRANSQKD